MESKIKQYMTIVRSLLHSIKSLNCSPDNFIDNFREALLFNLTDMVAKAVTKPSETHKSKFINYIKNFGDWDDQDNVSLPQLYYYLEKESSPDLGELRQYVSDKLKSWPKSQYIGIEIDPKYSEINDMWPKEVNGLSRVKLYYFTHANLLYAQRNNLIHEMRRKSSTSIFESTTPHYSTFLGEVIRDKETGNLKLADAPATFELFYPYEFYFNLLEGSLDKVEKYLLDNNINPFDAFNFEPIWFDLKE